jgi:cupin superfamily acireductone dioxygenase involved in methionine salvage
LKTLLRDVLDPAVEHVQHAKTQRERIHNDNVYFTSSRHPENAPAWTYKEIHYETDDEIYGEELQNEEEYVRVQGEGGVQEEAEYYREGAGYYEFYGEDDEEYFARIEEEDYDLLPAGSDFIRDSAEMNAVRPEDLDEQGEGSKVSLVVFIANFILY